MSWEQTRKITELMAAMKRSERAIQKLQRKLALLTDVAGTAITQIETGYPYCAARKLREAISEEDMAMTVLTDGLVTESDRLALINAIVDPSNPANIHAVTKLALKLGVTRESLLQAAQCHDEGALAQTEVSERIRGWLGECG